MNNDNWYKRQKELINAIKPYYLKHEKKLLQLDGIIPKRKDAAVSNQTKIAYLKEERLWLRVLIKNVCDDYRLPIDMRREILRRFNDIIKVYAYENIPVEEPPTKNKSHQCHADTTCTCNTFVGLEPDDSCPEHGYVKDNRCCVCGRFFKMKRSDTMSERERRELLMTDRERNQIDFAITLSKVMNGKAWQEPKPDTLPACYTATEEDLLRVRLQEIDATIQALFQERIEIVWRLESKVSLKDKAAKVKRKAAVDHNGVMKAKP